MLDNELFVPKKLTYGEVKELIEKFDAWSGTKLSSFCSLLGIRIEGNRIRKEIDWEVVIADFLKLEQDTYGLIIPKHDVYKHYVNYCANKGLSPKTSPGFSRYLTEKIGIASIKWKRIKGERMRVYVFDKVIQEEGEQE